MGAVTHKLLFELGRGGTATVHLAVTHGPAGFTKLIVVKRLHHDLAVDAEAVEMFTAEARVTALLNHPNVVQVHDIALDGDEYVIEMEYLEGQSLEAILRRAATAGGFPIELGLWVLTQVLTGLHFAHELRGADGEPLDVVHRDVSPHNVFVTYEGTVKVVDFGIAKARDSVVQTETGLIKGKVAYMSPEQALREPVDRRADVFAVGVVLWRILTGKRLWAGMSDFEIFTKLSRGEMPSPRTARADVAPELEAICMRALARARADRFDTAAAMQAAIEQYLETTSPRTGAKQLARYVGGLFGDARDAMKTRVDERLAALSADRDAEEEDAESTSELQTGSRASRKARATPQPSMGRRRAALGLALSMAVGGVALVSWMTRPRPPEHGAIVSASAQPAAAPACTASRDCPSDGDAASVCRAGRCVRIASAECRAVAAPAHVANDATLWVGAMYSIGDFEADRAAARAVELARDDFMGQTGGIPPATGVGPSRPIGLVVCDDAGDYARVARHLVDDLRVPVVLGFGESKEVIELAPSLFLPNDVLVLATTNPSPFIASIPQPPNGPRLVWRTTLDAAYEAPAIAAMVADVFEPRVRAKLGAAKEPMRVALARTDNSVGLGLASALFSLVRFNGRSVMDNGASWTEVLLPDHATDPERFRASVDALVAFRPHLIITYAAGRDLTTPLYAELEARWPPDAVRPLVFIKDYPHRDDFAAFLAADAERRRRYFGVTPPITTPASVKLLTHYNQHAPAPVPIAKLPRDPYDAFYLLAYAAFAAGDGPLTGSGLARGIARLLPPGKRVEVGPAEIFDVFRILRAGENVDLAGAETSLDFDVTTGNPTSDLVLLCAHTSPSGAVTFAESGVAYEAATHKLTGRAVCQ